MTKSKVYTRKGDDGTTSLNRGVRVRKCDVRVEAYGTVDELNSFVGLLLTHITGTDETALLEQVQCDLFAIGSELATPTTDEDTQASVIDSDDIVRLERAIDSIETGLPSWRGFVLPGGCPSAAVSHICRTVCRRAERRILALSGTTKVSETILAYMNRLSDYFFVLARKSVLREGKKETVWKKKKV